MEIRRTTHTEKKVVLDFDATGLEAFFEDLVRQQPALFGLRSQEVNGGQGVEVAFDTDGLTITITQIVVEEE